MIARPGKKTRCGAVKTWLRSALEHRAPFGRRRLRAQPEERERRGVEDGRGDPQRALDDQRCEGVGQDRARRMRACRAPSALEAATKLLPSPRARWRAPPGRRPGWSRSRSPAGR